MASRNDRTALVTGGHGFLGSHLVDLLLERGARVRCLLRPGRDTGVFQGKPVEVARGDLRFEQGLEEAVRGVGVVYHVAGLIAARGPAEFARVNAAGTRRLAAAVRRASPSCSRFLYVSSQTAAGPSLDGSPVTEDDRPRPITHYGRSKLAGERTLASALRGVPFTILRPPAIYGPRDAALLPFFRLASMGLWPALQGRGRRFNLLHARDVAEGIRAAAESPGAAGGTFFLADSGGVEYEDVRAAMGRAYGRRTQPVPMPGFLLRLAGVLTDEIAHLGGKVPVFGRQKAIELNERWWLCSAARAHRVFRWRPRVSLDEGITETARWYGQSGRVRHAVPLPGGSL